jgi:hypothetical protein
MYSRVESVKTVRTFSVPDDLSFLQFRETKSDLGIDNHARVSSREACAIIGGTTGAEALAGPLRGVFAVDHVQSRELPGLVQLNVAVQRIPGVITDFLGLDSVECDVDEHSAFLLMELMGGDFTEIPAALGRNVETNAGTPAVTGRLWLL